METIEFIPDRTDFEKVTKVHIAKIILHDDFLEIRLAYDYIDVIKDPDTGAVFKKTERVQCHDIIPRHQIALARTTVDFSLDTRENPAVGHVVQVLFQSQKFWIWATPKECERIFKKLIDWFMKKK